MLVDADTVIAGLVQAQEGDFQNLTAQTAFMQYLEANLITTGRIDVDDLRAKLATVDILNANYFSANSAFITSLQSLASSSATSVITDAYISNAVVGKISVGDLAAGNIVLDDYMTITSENGALLMNGSALQIIGQDSQGNDYVGIQLGYDTNSNPSLILRNEDGATILTPEGITANAIADSLIVNNMIANGTISKSKLGFNVMEQGDSITIEQIYNGNQQFGAEWTTFKNGTNDALSDLRTDLDNKNSYQLYIEAPNGTNIYGGDINLNARLFENNTDVTDDYDDSCFIWTRMSRDSESDIYWNTVHSAGAKIITVTASDVRINANFQCRFQYDTVSAVSGQSGYEPHENAGIY